MLKKQKKPAAARGGGGLFMQATQDSGMKKKEMIDHINKIKNSKGRTSTLFSEVSSEYMSMYSKSFPDRIPIKIPNSSSVKYVEVHYSEITYNNLKRDFSEALKLSGDL